MSNVVSVTYGKILKESLLSSVDNFRTKIALCSLKMSIKSSRILKWNAGVKIYFGWNKMWDNFCCGWSSRLRFTIYLSPWMPFLTKTCQKSSPKPRMKIRVIGAFVDMFWTTQNRLFKRDTREKMFIKSCIASSFHRIPWSINKLDNFVSQTPIHTWMEMKVKHVTYFINFTQSSAL